MADDDPQGMAGFSELARKRRQEAATVSELALPHTIEAVTSSSALFSFYLPSIPLTHLNPTKFVEAVKAAYGSSIDPPNAAPLLAKYGRDAVLQMDEEEILRKTLQLDENPILQFGTGRFPTRHDFIEIISMFVNSESVLAHVKGAPSKIAETIVAELMEMMWQAAGVSKKWEDMNDLIMAKAYSTATKTSFDVPLEKLLDPRVVTFLEDRGQYFASYMGRLTRNNGFEPPKKFVASTAIDELHFNISGYDIATGRNEKHTVKFSVLSSDDYGTGRVRITTDMNYDKHVELVAELAEIIGLAS